MAFKTDNADYHENPSLYSHNHPENSSEQITSPLLQIPTGSDNRATAHRNGPRFEQLFKTLRQISIECEAGRSDLPASIAFLAGYGVPLKHLTAAVIRAKRLAVSPESVLIANGLMSEAAYFDLLADQLGLARIGSETRLAKGQEIGDILPSQMARVAGRDGRETRAFVPGAARIRWLLAGGAKTSPVDLCLVSRQEFEALLLNGYRAALLEEAGFRRLERRSQRSARAGISAGQRIFGLCCVVLIAGFIWIADDIATPVLISLLCLAFLGTLTLRLAALFAHDEGFSPARRLNDGELPIYTVLVALYREDQVIPKLVRALRSLDYPPEKLDIKLILESDDLKTRTALAAQTLPGQFSILIMPPGEIKTKPRALNMALLFTHGELVTIFDAEDEPEPDQLRRAASIFAARPAELACLQASLVPDNADDGLIQSLFALEYAALFDIIKRGFCGLGFPIPLGGTSNHFRRAALEKIGAWDAFNVTEDAELGLRLYREGYKIEALNSSTYEEAPNDLRAWFNQRRRWSKGWLQTAIAHSHNPIIMVQKYGTGRFLLGAFMIIGTLLGILLYPFGLIALAMRIFYGDPFFAGDLIHSISDLLALLVVYIGVFMMFAPTVFAMSKRKLSHLAPLLPLLPLYGLMISLAAWVALFDLAHRPFHWLKTEHGFARTSLRKSRSNG